MNDGTQYWFTLILDGAPVGEWRPAHEVTVNGWVRFDVDRHADTASIAMGVTPTGPMIDQVIAMTPVNPGDWIGFRIADMLR